MKKTIFIVIIMIMLGWIAYDFIFSSNEEQKSSSVEVEESDEIGILKGELAPDFELTTLDGDVVKLSDYRGQRVMLNFWATWCPPCRAEMPDMQKFQDNKDVQVLAVNLYETESNPANIQSFIDELDLTLTAPLDKDSAVSNEYEVVAYPTTYMIDSNGRIQSVVMGALNYDFMVQQFEMMR